MLAETAVRTGRKETAAEQIVALAGESQLSVPSILRVVEVCRAIGDHEHARRLLENAQRTAPKSAAVWIATGLMFEQTAKPEDARAAYRKAIEYEPENGIALNNLAFLIAETGGGRCWIGPCSQGIASEARRSRVVGYAGLVVRQERKASLGRTDSSITCR